MEILALLFLAILAFTVFSSSSNNEITDYELYGDIDPHIYGECMASKEYERGYLSAKKMIEENKHNPITLLNEAKNDLEEDDFFRGWKRGCKEHIY